MALTVGCLFSGMGGFASGLAAAGFDIRWANDNDPSACEAFRRRFPDLALIEKDVRKLSVAGDGLPSVDVLAAAFPCQSFSQAGDAGASTIPAESCSSKSPGCCRSGPKNSAPSS